MTAGVVLLGTGSGPTPKANRNAPAQALLVEGSTYLVDAGNAVSPQLVKAGISLGSLRAVFLTHHHSDHNADFGTLFLASWSQLQSPVALFGPPPLARMTELFFEMHAQDIEARTLDEGRAPLRQLVEDHEVSDDGLVYEDDRVRVSAARVHHPPLEIAFAYRFDTSERSVVFSGDTTPCPELIDLARGADVLVHEAIYLPALEAGLGGFSRVPNLRHHLLESHTSAEDAGAVAQEAGVQTLVLTHLFPPDGGVSDDLWTASARSRFGGTVIVGRDLLVV